MPPGRYPRTVSQGSVVHFQKFLNDLGDATNESQKRHLFTTLAAVGFDQTDFATELALVAEYRTHFKEKGLLRRGAVDSFRAVIEGRPES